MIYPAKKLKASATTRPPSTSSVARIVSGSGLDNLLFAFSAVTVDTKSRDVAAVAQLEGKCAKTTVQPTFVTIDHNGGVEEESSGLEGKEEEVSSSEYNSESSSASLDAPQSVKNFPRILHEILSTPECQTIIHWLPNGLSFIIADKQRFSDEILPTYFNRGILRSFIRKLNRWGFRRVKSRCKGEESSFAHNSFVRDKPGLCSEMKCKSKPSYHKALSAKKERNKAKVAVIKAKSLSNDVVPSQEPPSLATTGGGRMVNVGSGCFLGTSTLSTATPTVANVAAGAGGFPNVAIAAAFATPIRDRSFLASFRPQNPQQQRFSLEMQFPVGQMSHGGQDYLLQAELHRLREMPSFDDNYLQRFMVAQYVGDLMRRRRNTFHS